MSKTERNYDAHKLEFLALKWSITERFHEYLYGGKFDVYTDNNPLTYVLTTAKLDAMGQRWIASLAYYDFKIFYQSGHLNVNADSLSRIPWEMETSQSTPLNKVLAKSVITTLQISIRLPMLSNVVIATHELVVRSDLRLTKPQWRQEQRNDYSIKHLIELLESDQILTYNSSKQDPSDCMLRLKKDFFLNKGLLYHKTLFKTMNKEVDQFVMPQQFRKRTVRVCHEDHGHLGMDCVQILLQERSYWPKLSEDVRTVIRSCDRCMRFKTTPQQDEMYTITATYPLQLIHLDFLTIGGKEDVFKNVLVVTDYFTRYVQCYCEVYLSCRCYAGLSYS